MPERHPLETVAPLSRVENNPLQLPGRDSRIRSVTAGGPETRRDCRMYIDRKSLQLLLDVANRAPSGRAMLGQVGVRVDVYETPGGHRYETWTLISEEPRPELESWIGG
jgi:hypothetical protein